MTVSPDGKGVTRSLLQRQPCRVYRRDQDATETTKTLCLLLAQGGGLGLLATPMEQQLYQTNASVVYLIFTFSTMARQSGLFKVFSICVGEELDFA